MTPTETTGPVLVLDDISGNRLHIAALFLAAPGTRLPPVSTPAGEHPVTRIATFGGLEILRARFDLPADAPSSYGWDGQEFAVAGDMTGDLRLAYVSCNGMEEGDLDRPEEERNAMWARLAEDHDRAPFALLLQGGDQIYADECTRGHPLSDGWPKEIPAVAAEALDDLEAYLERRFATRYHTLYGHSAFARLSARVPSLSMWDDHDICDGWGSLGSENTAIGQCLYRVARKATLLFQHATTDGDLPPRCLDPGGQHLGWKVETPGLRILAPDLRGERTRARIMGPGGWGDLRAAAAPRDGQTLLMSSTPLLGPRLSLIEQLMPVLPASARDYEDDLRDQWQSHAHRPEWREMLRLVDRMMQGGPVTVLSGEIHLATRATMTTPGGATLHQLVASGIAHPPPPKVFARVLGALAGLGEAPLERHPIRIHPLPGHRTRYVAERNYLTLIRADDAWQARWTLEHSGTTPPQALSAG